MRNTQMSGDVVVYVKLDGDHPDTTDINSIVQLNNEQIFDVINSNMTRDRGLKEIIGTLPLFESIIPQLKAGTVVVEIGCGDKKTAKDIKDQKPEIQMYAIDIKDTGKVEGVNFLRQNLLEGIKLPPKTQVAYSFYTLQYLPDPLSIVQKVYDQLETGGVAILHMGPLGIFSENIGIYINKNNNQKTIQYLQTKQSDIDDKFLPGDYIIVHKRKDGDNSIRLPITKSFKLDKIGIKGPNAEIVEKQNNGDLMYNVTIDHMKTETRDYREDI